MSDKDKNTEFPNTFNLRNAFKFVLEIPGIDPYIVKSVKNLEGNRLLVELRWIDDRRDLPCPLWKCFQSPLARLIMFGKHGPDLEFNISYDGYDFLPFDLDYENSKHMIIRYIFKNVYYNGPYKIEKKQ